MLKSINQRGAAHPSSNMAARAACLGFMAAIVSMPAFADGVETVLHEFKGDPIAGYPPYDGKTAVSGLTADAAGNFYGAGEFGGKYGFGTVFKLTPDGKGGFTYKTIYDLGTGEVERGIDDGAVPNGQVAVDNHGHLYVTTEADSTVGNGGVFELVPNQKGEYKLGKTMLFNGVGTNGNNGDGAKPEDGVVVDDAGNLFGTTRIGGTTLGDGGPGYGTVFELIPAGHKWTVKTLHRFKSGKDGEFPFAGLIIDSTGDLFGAEPYGGRNGGTVFRMHKETKGWQKTIIHAFDPDGRGGVGPEATLAFDAMGNIYGTTNVPNPSVFKLTRPADIGGRWKLTTLHRFSGGADGGSPGQVILDGAGNIYGSAGGGNQACSCGLVYQLTPTVSGSWTQTILYNFTGGRDGGNPIGALALGIDGLLYGTTYSGGIQNIPDEANNGVVFSLTK
jgi:hypothetical protein